MASEAPVSKAFDFKATLVATAMYAGTGSLQGKLSAIWMFAASLAGQAEEKHSEEIGSLQGSPVKMPSSLHLKAQQLRNQSFHAKRTPLQTVYMDLLATAREIHITDQKIRARAVRPMLSATMDDGTYLAALLDADSMSCRSFLDQVVPHFFALQLHCYRMYPMVEFPQTVPVDPIIRQARAAKGGGAKAIGEDLLKEKFSEFLESLGKRSFQSKKAFFRRLEDELAAILDDYQAHQLHKPHPKTKRKVTYGHDLVADSLERKFREWQKNDPVFEKRFLALLAKKGKTPESS